MTTDLCHPLLDQNLCRGFNTETKPPKHTIKLRDMTLWVPITNSSEVPCELKLLVHLHLLTQLSLLLPMPNLYKSRTAKLQIFLSLLLVNSTVTTPKRGRPSSGNGSPVMLMVSRCWEPSNGIPAKRPTEVQKDIHVQVKTKTGCCRCCNK